MRPPMSTVACFILCSALVRTGLVAQLPIREIAAPINDLAIASYDQFGRVIYYNPMIAQRVGPAVTQFTRAHEYGHHIMGHVDRARMIRDPYVRIMHDRVAEREADSVATAYWMSQDPRLLDVVIRFLEDPATGNPGDVTHLPTAVRAQLMRQWIGGSTPPSAPVLSPDAPTTRPDAPVTRPRRTVSRPETPGAARIAALARAIQQGPAAARALRGRPDGDGEYELRNQPAAMYCTIDREHVIYCIRNYFAGQDGPGAYEKLREDLQALLTGWTEEEFELEDGDVYGVDFTTTGVSARVGWDGPRRWLYVMISPG